MASTLARQLRLLSSHGVSVATAASPAAPSLVFDARAAADMDLDTVYEIAVNGLDAIAAGDKRILAFKVSLFHAATARADIDALTPESRASVAQLVTQCLETLAPHFLSPACHSCLEWLIRRFRVLSSHGLQLLDLALPFHSTPVAAKLLALIDASQQSMTAPMKMIVECAQQLNAVPRSVIVAACKSDARYLAHLAAVAQTRRLPASLALVTAVTVEVLQQCEPRSAQLSSLLNALTPSIFTGLDFSRHRHLGLHAESLLQLAAINRAATINADLCNEFVVRLIQSVKSTRDAAVHRANVMAVAYVVSEQRLRTLGRDVVDSAVEASDALIAVIAHIRARFDIRALIDALCDSALNIAISVTGLTDATAERAGYVTFIRALIDSQCIDDKSTAVLLSSLIDRLSATANLEPRTLSLAQSLVVRLDQAQPKAVESFVNARRHPSDSTPRKRRRDGSAATVSNEAITLILSRLTKGTRHGHRHAESKLAQMLQASHADNTELIDTLKHIEPHAHKKWSDDTVAEVQFAVSRALEAADPSVALSALTLPKTLAALPADWLRAKLIQLVSRYTGRLHSASVPLLPVLPVLCAAFRVIESLVQASPPTLSDFLPALLEYSLDHAETRAISREVRAVLSRLSPHSPLLARLDSTDSASDPVASNEKFVKSLAAAAAADESRLAIHQLLRVLEYSAVDEASLGLSVAALTLNLVLTFDRSLVDGSQLASLWVRVYSALPVSARRALTPSASFYAHSRASLPVLLRFVLERLADGCEAPVFDTVFECLARMDTTEFAAHFAPVVATLTSDSISSARITDKLAASHSVRVQLRCCEILAALAAVKRVDAKQAPTTVLVLTFAGVRSEARSVRAAALLAIQTLSGSTSLPEHLAKLCSALQPHCSELVADRSHQALAAVLASVLSTARVHRSLLAAVLALPLAAVRVTALRALTATRSDSVAPDLVDALQHARDASEASALLECLATAAPSALAKCNGVERSIIRVLDESDESIVHRAAQLAVSIFALLNPAGQSKLFSSMLSRANASSLVLDSLSSLTLPSQLVVSALKESGSESSAALLELLADARITFTEAHDVAVALSSTLSALNQPEGDDALRVSALAALQHAVELSSLDRLSHDLSLAPVLACLRVADDAGPPQLGVRLAALSLLPSLAARAPDSVRAVAVEIVRDLGALRLEEMDEATFAATEAALVALSARSSETGDSPVAWMQAGAAGAELIATFFTAASAQLNGANSLRTLSLCRALLLAVSPHALFFALPLLATAAHAADERENSAASKRARRKEEKKSKKHAQPDMNLTVAHGQSFDSRQFVLAWLEAFPLAVRLRAFDTALQLDRAARSAPKSKLFQSSKLVTLSQCAALPSSWLADMLLAHFARLAFAAELLDAITADDAEERAAQKDLCARLLQASAEADHSNARVALTQAAERFVALMTVASFVPAVRDILTAAKSTPALVSETLRVIVLKAAQVRALARERSKDAGPSHSERRALLATNEADRAEFFALSEPVIATIQSRSGQMDAQLAVVALESIAQTSLTGADASDAQAKRVASMARAAPVLVAAAKAGPSAATDSALLALATLVSACHAALLPALPAILEAAIQRATETLQRPKGVRADSLTAALVLVRALLSSLPSFLSAHLASLAAILFDTALTQSETDAAQIASECRSLVVETQDARLILTELARFANAITAANAEPFYHFFEAFLHKLSASELRAAIKPVLRVFLLGLTVRARRSDSLTDDAVSVLEDSCVGAFVRFTLKLNEAQMRATFNKILQATLTNTDSTFPVDVATGSAALTARLRASIPLMKLALALSVKLGPIFAPLASTWFDAGLELASQTLTASARAPSVEALSFLRLSLRAFARALDSDEERTLAKQRSEKLFAFSATLLRQTPQLAEEFVAFISALASNLGHFHLWKPMQLALAEAAAVNSGAPPATRALFVEALAGLFVTLGASYLVMMPETLPLMSELLEDDDATVSRQLAKLISIVEELSGESLDRFLTV